MILSMTGFGRKEETINNKKIIIDIRTLNSKYLDINFNIHESFHFIDEYLRRILKEKIIKGKVDITLNVQDLSEDIIIPYDKSKIKLYIRELKKDFKINESDIISSMLNDKAYSKSNISFTKNEESRVKVLFNSVIDEHLKYRKIEGEAIFKDLNKSVQIILAEIKKILAKDSKRINDKKKKFRDYFRELNLDFDKQRLEQEIIYYIEKFDINEEIIRLSHHLKFFGSEMKSKSTKGKKLSFIAQEIGREINTIGSKANNFKIQNAVVNMKEELEKIKENIYNIL